MKIIRILSIILFLFLFNSFKIMAEPIDNRVNMVFDGEPSINISADEIDYLQDKNIAVFKGRVVITRGLDRMEADQALWNDLSKTAELQGNIKFESPDFTAIAERAIVNMDIQMAKIYKGKAFFPSRHYYISGDVIERYGQEGFYIKNGLATTCDGPEPAWVVQADDITISREGMAQASGVSLKNKYLPLAYVPYLAFPVSTQRQSGFLFPSFYSSSRDGFTISQPIFWATGENHDITFLPVWRAKRGVSTTLEGRYNLKYGEGIWFVSYLDDKKAPSYSYLNEPFERKTAKNRYWLRTQNVWNFNDYKLNLDLDMVSDPLYLDEFKNSSDGFNHSFDTFSDVFGYAMNEVRDPIRNSSLYLQKNYEDSYFKASLNYKDNLNNNKNLDTYYSVPSIYYSIASKPLTFLNTGENQIRFSADFKYDYFTRKSNSNSLTNETGNRFIAAPSLFYTQNIGSFANLDLRGGVNLINYAPKGYRLAPYGDNFTSYKHDSSASRIDSYFSADLSSTIEKVYHKEVGDYSALRHQITPTIGLKYFKAEKNNSLPFWDYWDRNNDQITLKYGILNTITGKRTLTDPENQIQINDYTQLFAFSILGSYEFKSDLGQQSDEYIPYYSQNYFGRGSGPIEFNLESNFSKYFYSKFVSRMDGRTGKFSSHDIYIQLVDTRGDSLYMIYDFASAQKNIKRYNYNGHRQLKSGINFKITDSLKIDFSNRYDLKEKKSLENIAAIRFDDQCYTINLLYSKVYNEGNRFGLLIDLFGLSSLNSF